MALSPAAEQVRERTNRELIDLLRRAGEHLPAPEQADFGSYFDRFSHARLVMLGEATHGTSEFYRARAAITRRLIERHGFNIVAVEADWPDAAVLDHVVRQLPAEPAHERPFERFPTWMSRNLVRPSGITASCIAARRSHGICATGICSIRCNM